MNSEGQCSKQSFLTAPKSTICFVMHASPVGVYSRVLTGLAVLTVLTVLACEVTRDFREDL